MSVRSARKYERGGRLPSELRAPRTHRTRPDRVAEGWPWVRAQLERDGVPGATTLFALLCERHPGRYQRSQLPTLQRQVAAWHAHSGPERDLVFPQVHRPGRLAQSDGTRISAYVAI